MKGRRSKKEEFNFKKALKRGLLALIFLGIICIVCGIIWYFSSISPVDKNDESIVEIEVTEGETAIEIADTLLKNNMIKNKTAFKIYIKLNSSTDLKAGTYNLKRNMSLKEIMDTMKAGNVTELSITLIEGKNMRWLAKEIASKTNNTEDDIFNLLKNEDYINSLIEKYWFITDEVKNENIYYPLEGYLFPDTYAIKSKSISVEEIFEKMLDRMEEMLSEYKETIIEKQYNVNKILTISSIIEMESMSEDERKDVASVIYNRLKKGMAIQSDVTTYYAFKVDVGERDLYIDEINSYNPYNTRGPNMDGKLPIGPISSVSKSCIDATLNPNNTEYLFFVADKNGKLYFSKTNEEHEQTIKQLKNDGLWLEY